MDREELRDILHGLRELATDYRRDEFNEGRTLDTQAPNGQWTSDVLYRAAGMLELETSRANWREWLQRGAKIVGLTIGVIVSIPIALASSYALRAVLNPHGAGWTKVGTASCTATVIGGRTCVYCEGTGVPFVSCDWK